MLPTEVHQALEKVGTKGLPGTLAEESCEGSKFHSPTPLILHGVTLESGRVVQLCGTCRDNLAVLSHLLTKRQDDWPLRRSFGNLLRSLALEGR